MDYSAQGNFTFERTYTELEKLLIQFGFTEMFGIGLFAVSEKRRASEPHGRAQRCRGPTHR